MGARPLPRVLELGASEAADFPAFDHVGPLLHAWSLAVPHPTEGQGVLRVAAPLPADMYGPMWKTRPIWPASAAQAADWPRLAEAQGSLRHDLALKGASGESAG